MNAKQMAVTGAKKIQPSRVIRMKWSEVKKVFGEQVKNMAGPGQRNHAAQVESGWNHIKGTVLSVQSTLQVVCYEGPAKGLMPKYIIVDGYHRVEYWMGLEDGIIVTDACPFTRLNVEIHTVTADTEEEAVLLTDNIARTFNSMDSVKKNGDYLSAAVRQAGLNAISNGYRTGRGSGVATFLKRAIGNPDQSSPALTASAALHINAHSAMDSVLEVVESMPSLRTKRSRMFNPGVMQALFEHFQRLNDVKLGTATQQVVNALCSFGGTRTGVTLSLTPVEADLYKTFCDLCSEDFALSIRAYGNREEQYNRLAALLRERFASLGYKRKVSLKLVKR